MKQNSTDYENNDNTNQWSDIVAELLDSMLPKVNIKYSVKNMNLDNWNIDLEK